MILIWGLAVERVSIAFAVVSSIDWTGCRAGLGISSSACFFVVIVLSCAIPAKGTRQNATAAAILLNFRIEFLY